MLFRFSSASGYCPHCLFLPSINNKSVKLWWILSCLIGHVQKRWLWFNFQLTEWVRISLENNTFSLWQNIYSFKNCALGVQYKETKESVVQNSTEKLTFGGINCRFIRRKIPDLETGWVFYSWSNVQMQTHVLLKENYRTCHLCDELWLHNYLQDLSD